MNANVAFIFKQKHKFKMMYDTCYWLFAQQSQFFHLVVSFIDNMNDFIRIK